MRGNTRIVDERRGSQRRDGGLEFVRADFFPGLVAMFELRNGFDIEIQDVQKRPARRAVRTRLLGIVGEERMQRIDADDIGTGCRRLLDQRREVGKMGPD